MVPLSNISTSLDVRINALTSSTEPRAPENIGSTAENEDNAMEGMTYFDEQLENHNSMLHYNNELEPGQLGVVAFGAQATDTRGSFPEVQLSSMASLVGAEELPRSLEHQLSHKSSALPDSEAILANSDLLFSLPPLPSSVRMTGYDDNPFENHAGTTTVTHSFSMVDENKQYSILDSTTGFNQGNHTNALYAGANFEVDLFSIDGMSNAILL